MLFTKIARTWAVQRDGVNTAIIHSYSKKSRLMNTRKKPSKGNTTNDKGQMGQKDLKGVSHDEISTKKAGSNVRMINSN